MHKKKKNNGTLYTKKNIKYCEIISLILHEKKTKKTGYFDQKKQKTMGLCISKLFLPGFCLK